MRLNSLLFLAFGLLVGWTHGVLAAGPLVVLLVAVAVASRLAPRFRFELRGLERFWLPVTMIAPAGLALFNQWTGGGDDGGLAPGLFALMLLSATVHSAVIASEFTSGTAATWVAQPRSLSALVFEKWLVTAGLSGLSLAQVLAVCPWPQQWNPLTGPVLAVVIGGVPVAFALILEETIAAAFVTFVACVLPMAVLLPVAQTQAAGLFQRALDVLLPLGSLAVLGLVLRRPRAALLLQVREPAAFAFSPGRGSPLRALLLKELRLQAPALGLMLGLVVLSAVATAETRVPLTLFGALMVTALVGISSVLSEKSHHTFLPELALLPVATVWRAKSLVAAGLAAVGGVALPLALLSLRAERGFFLQDGARFPLGVWMLAVGLLLCLALASSVFVQDLKSAFAVVLVGGAVMMCAFVFLVGAGWWLVTSFAEPANPVGLFHIPAWPVVALPRVLGPYQDLSQGLHTALLAVPALGLGLLLLAIAREGFLGGAFPKRRVAFSTAALGSGAFVFSALDVVRALVS